MMKSRAAVGGLALALLGLSGTGLDAQVQEMPRDQLQPLRPRGDIVAPFYDGYYANPDGTFTLSFGFFNRNTEEIVEIPIGENNRLEPAEYNGNQPTYFPPVSYGGFGGRRERGAFAVVVPADFADGTKSVNWTITHAGKTYTVPGRIGSAAYSMGYAPAAAGSLPPSVKWTENGEASTTRIGVWGDPINARVGQAVPLRVFVDDRSERPEKGRVNTAFLKHQGPIGGKVTIEPASIRLDNGTGEAAATATFDTPGEYVIRARVDNFGASDSSWGNQCCWSNAYVKVTVTQ